jgi:hypothetical protein
MSKKKRVTAIIATAMLFSTATFSVMLFWGSCSKKEAPEGEGTEADSEKEKKAAKGKERGKQNDKEKKASGRAGTRARAAAQPPVNAQYAEAVKKAAQKCDMASINSCKEYAPVEKLRDRKGAALEMLVSAVTVAGGEDIKQANVAARSLKRLSSGIRNAFKTLKEEPSKVDQKQIKKLLEKAFENLPKLHRYNAINGAKIYGMLAGLYGLTASFLDAAQKHPKAGDGIARTGVAYFMTYGGLKAFPAVKKIAERKGGGPKGHLWLVAALKSPRWMRKWKKEEYEKICPWAAKHLEHESPRVGAAAGHLMNKCKTHDVAYIGKLLAAGKKRIEKRPETWKNPVDFPFRNVCFGGFFGRAKRPGKKNKKGVTDVCAKTYDFLVWTTAQKGVSDDMKKRAISWITYQERTKHALKWLRKLRKSRDKKVRAHAKKQIAYLKKHYLKKKK